MSTNQIRKDYQKKRRLKRLRLGQKTISRNPRMVMCRYRRGRLTRLQIRRVEVASEHLSPARR